MYDLEELTGRPFDPAAYSTVTQFLYMGEADKNDTLPYSDAYDEISRRLTRSVLGESMPDRWRRAQSIYRETGYPVRFVTYRETGHEVTPTIMTDIVEFFRPFTQQ